MGVILVDGYGVGYTAVQQPELTANGQDVTAVYHTLRILKAIKKRSPLDYKMVFLWEGHAEWRQRLWPLYKGNRQDNEQMMVMRERFRAQRHGISNFLHKLGITQIRCPTAEADDLAGILAPIYSARGEQIVLATKDKDWLQLVDENVRWHDFSRKLTISHANFAQFTGFESSRLFVQGKAMMGDSSDNIPGVGGLGEKTAVAFAEHFGSVKKFLEYLEANPDFPKEDLPAGLRRARKKLLDFAQDEAKLTAFKRNLLLMDLCAAKRFVNEGDFRIVRGEKDMDEFQKLCEELHFKTLLMELEDTNNCF